MTDTPSLGLIGTTLSHSYSKLIHGMLSPDIPYTLWELPNNTLFSAFMEQKNFLGINVTMPYKCAVIPYLDHISPRAERIGAVNTVYRRDGTWWGENTDYLGMRQLFSLCGIDVKGKKVLILGTGGTSQTARVAAQDLGAEEIYRVSRMPVPGQADIIGYNALTSAHTDADILINCTPVGMYPQCDECPVDIRKFPQLSGVIDAVYNPTPTRLIADAKRAEIPCAGGLYMLVVQAIEASKLFLGRTYPPGTLREVYEALKNRFSKT